MNSWTLLSEASRSKLQYTAHISDCPLLTHTTNLWQKKDHLQNPSICEAYHIKVARKEFLQLDGHLQTGVEGPKAF